MNFIKIYLILNCSGGCVATTARSITEWAIAQKYLFVSFLKIPVLSFECNFTFYISYCSTTHITAQKAWPGCTEEAPKKHWRSIEIKQWTNPNLKDKQIWLWEEVKIWYRSRRSSSATLNIIFIILQYNSHNCTQSMTRMILLLLLLIKVTWRSGLQNMVCYAWSTLMVFIRGKLNVKVKRGSTQREALATQNLDSL